MKYRLVLQFLLLLSCGLAWSASQSQQGLQASSHSTAIKCSAQYKTGTQEYVDANQKNPNLFGYSFANRMTDGARNIGNSIDNAADKVGGFVVGLAKGAVEATAQTGLAAMDAAKASGAAQLQAITGYEAQISPVSAVGQL